MSILSPADLFLWLLKYCLLNLVTDSTVLNYWRINWFFFLLYHLWNSLLSFHCLYPFEILSLRNFKDSYMNNYFLGHFLLLILIHLEKTNPSLWGNQIENTVNAEIKINVLAYFFSFFWTFRILLAMQSGEILLLIWILNTSFQCNQIKYVFSVNKQVLFLQNPSFLYVWSEFGRITFSEVMQFCHIFKVYTKVLLVNFTREIRIRVFWNP